MDEVEVKVVDAPVGELLFANGLDLFGVMEGVPELRDNEEFLSLYETLLDRTGNALARFDFVAVVCAEKESVSENQFRKETALRFR